MSFSVEVRLEIDGRGLDIVVAQVIFDISDGGSPIEQTHSPGMTEIMFWLGVATLSI